MSKWFLTVGNGGCDIIVLLRGLKIEIWLQGQNRGQLVVLIKKI